MFAQREADAVKAAVRLRIGVGRRAQQAQTEVAVAAREAVFGFGHQREPLALFISDRGPTVARHFPHRFVLLVARLLRTLDRTKGCSEPGPAATVTGGNVEFQQAVIFAPIDSQFGHQPAAVGFDNPLDDCVAAFADGAFAAQAGAQGAGLAQLQWDAFGDLVAKPRDMMINIPGVKERGMILIETQAAVAGKE